MDLTRKVKGNELEAIKLQMEKSKNYLDPVNLEMDETDLIDIITLGDNWDDPMALMKAMDEHPTYFARWSYVYRFVQNKLDGYKEQYKVWEAKKKDELREQIFDENESGGMTPNNAKPTDSSVNTRFLKHYHQDCKPTEEVGEQDIKDYLLMMKKINIYTARVEKLKIVVEAFKQRTSMLVSMASLLKSMVDNNLLIMKKKRK